MARVLRLALLISGRGTTARTIIEACKNGALRHVYQPVCVISSAENCPGLDNLVSAGLDPGNFHVVNPKMYGNDVEQFSKVLLKLFRLYHVNCIGQYGWMVKTPENVIREYEGMMINQHPGPLDPGRPDFGGKGMFGMRVHCARLLFCRWTNRDYWTEAVAQRVALKVDNGEILSTSRMSIEQHDTPYSLKNRLLPQEHRLQIDTLEELWQEKPPIFVSTEPLVRDEEIPILERAKEVACTLFPKG